jgi:hypothetical protein
VGLVIIFILGLRYYSAFAAAFFATFLAGTPASTISITAIGALSPLRGPILVMRV